MQNISLDDLEIEYGTAILSDLTGQLLTRNQQPVRLFDQTQRSAEYYFRADARTGKPYVQDFQHSKRYYPISAYRQAYNVDLSTALTNLNQQYYGPTTAQVVRPRMVRPPLTLRIDYLPIDDYEQSRTLFERNGLYEYLRFNYGPDDARAVFSRYRLGTSCRWQYSGYLATCLPQFDVMGHLRQVKIIIFDAMNGRRIKKHQSVEQWNPQRKRFKATDSDTDKVYFAGKRIAQNAGRPDAYLSQCFFGEHLLAEYPDRKVAIVEGESTAIVCSIHWPQYVWLATGGRNGARWIDPDTFGVLVGRDVVLWPDNDCYADWCIKAVALRPLVKSLRVSDYVRRNAPEGSTKADLRDLLMQPYLSTQGGLIIVGEVLTTIPSQEYPLEWD